jgi:hypothetical protein
LTTVVCGTTRVRGEPAYPKIAQFYFTGVVEKYVGRLDVAVHELELSHVLEAAEDGEGELRYEQFGDG